MADQITGTIIKNSPSSTIIETYLVPADLTHIRCVDERRAEIPNSGVQMPGGVYGIADAIKSLTSCTEQEAWEKIITAHIPLCAHIDTHHEALGCGYGKLVETEPHTILAPESIPVATRLAYINACKGNILKLLGDHAPTYASINHRVNTTMDPERAVPANNGTFNYDYWAAELFADRLGLDPKTFADHLADVYMRTVVRLTNGVLHTFVEIL